ncbi:MAG: amidophosphoribosyltransferase [Bacteroidota bacterium]
MSDSIKHECGIALIRLLKPLDFYIKKYGTPLYGINKLYLLMEKQHNRGQDGAGVATIKFDVEPGQQYIHRHRSVSAGAIKEIFGKINEPFTELYKKDIVKFADAQYLKKNMPFYGELMLGHLRYGTYGGNTVENCHPFLRQNNWQTRNLVVAGNFNLTNVDELFQQLVDLGQHPREMADTVTVMERIGHFLDEENERLFQELKTQKLENKEISRKIGEQLDIQQMLSIAAKKWDGGYAMAGMIGHGDAFVTRDPWGIRPCHYYKDDEIVVVASERAVIQTAFKLEKHQIQELTPGHALIIKKNGEISEKPVRSPKEKSACSFERIYFSRGSDADIYEERKNLGRFVCEPVLKEINHDLKNTVLSFIPNTAEVAFYGMVKGMEDYLKEVKLKKILALTHSELTQEKLSAIIDIRPRVEKVAIKDAKLRTFITNDASRDDMVAHVYDITYDTVKKGKDNLVVIDDSIVRGTTLKQSILKMLDRLEPKKIVIVSSAPQIRYPDCYGIDMAKLGDFIAFQAAIALLKQKGMQGVIDEVYQKAKAQEKLPKEEITNVVKDIYAPFSYEEVSAKISELLTPEDCKAEVKIIYQNIDGLHRACPNHTGDWYFSGNYPTPGGNKVVNKAFINYIEGINQRAY